MIHLRYCPQGVVAVTCVEVAPVNTAVHGVLLWSLRDPIRPEVVLESPVEVQHSPRCPSVLHSAVLSLQVLCKL